jgi:hypothetical protein
MLYAEKAMRTIFLDENHERKQSKIHVFVDPKNSPSSDR